MRDCSMDFPQQHNQSLLVGFILLCFPKAGPENSEVRKKHINTKTNVE